MTSPSLQIRATEPDDLPGLSALFESTVRPAAFGGGVDLEIPAPPGRGAQLGGRAGSPRVGGSRPPAGRCACRPAGMVGKEESGQLVRLGGGRAPAAPSAAAGRSRPRPARRSAGRRGCALDLRFSQRSPFPPGPAGVRLPAARRDRPAGRRGRRRGGRAQNPLERRGAGRFGGDLAGCRGRSRRGPLGGVPQLGATMPGRNAITASIVRRCPASRASRSSRSATGRRRWPNSGCRRRPIGARASRALPRILPRRESNAGRSGRRPRGVKTWPRRSPVWGLPRWPRRSSSAAAAGRTGPIRSLARRVFSMAMGEL